jgi:hypothetical protein
VHEANGKYTHEMPASSTSTLTVDISLRRLATTRPAVPPKHDLRMSGRSCIWHARRTTDYNVVVVEARELSHILINSTERRSCAKNCSKRKSRTHDENGRQIEGSSAGRCWRGTLRVLSCSLALA